MKNLMNKVLAWIGLIFQSRDGAEKERLYRKEIKELKEQLSNLNEKMDELVTEAESNSTEAGELERMYSDLHSDLVDENGQPIRGGAI